MSSETASRTWLGRPTACRLAVLQVACITLLLAGCGSSERTFSPEGFVDAANADGAGLALGDRLDASREGVDVYGIAFAATGATGGGAPAEDSGGSLLVTASATAALAEYGRCQSGTGLLCFRVANVVVILEGGVAPENVARLTAAAKAMAAG